jgi:hypothetical protein
MLRPSGSVNDDKFALKSIIFRPSPHPAPKKGRPLTPHEDHVKNSTNTKTKPD